MNEWYDSLEEKEDNNILPDEQLQEPLYQGWEDEQDLQQALPNYKDYKWYKTPGENPYMFSLGEQMETALNAGDSSQVENIIEQNPEEAKETLNQVVEADNGIEKSEVEPLMQEVEQLSDSDKSNDEVSNEAIEEATDDIKKDKKIGSFLIDLPEYENMSVDEIEEADRKAMAGEAPYMEVNYLEDIGLTEEDLADFPTELPELTDEQKEEIRNEPDKEKKLDKLREFAASFASLSNGDMSTENVGGIGNDAIDNISASPISGTDTSVENNIDNTINSGVSPIDPSFSGGGSAGVNTAGIDVDIEAEEKDTSSNAGGGDVNTEVSERDSNTASMNGANVNEGIDNTFDNLSFKETDHESNIKTNEQFELGGEEGHTAKPNKEKLPNLKGGEKSDISAIKERIIEDSATWNSDNSGSKYLPFKFIVNGDKVEVSQVGTARKEALEQFIKDEPHSLRKIVSLFL